MSNTNSIYVSGYSCGLRDKKGNDTCKLCKWDYDAINFDLCWTCVCYLTNDGSMRYLGYCDPSNPKLIEAKTPVSPTGNAVLQTIGEKDKEKSDQQIGDSNCNTSDGAPQGLSEVVSYPAVNVTQEESSAWSLGIAGDDSFRSVVCGWGWTAGITTQGRCYLWKSTAFEKPYLPSSDGDAVDVVQVGLGEKHSAILTSDGKTYELVPQETCYSLRPLLIPMPVKQVSCGKEHVLLLTETGAVYTYGMGSRGQLGHGLLNHEEAPRLIEALENVCVKSVVAGGWHSAALDETGTMYLWGWNESGQLGLPCGKLKKGDNQSIVSIQATPHPVAFPQEKHVAKISLGSRHSAALTDGGELWTWGWNGYGQLDLGDTVTRDEPTLVTAFKGQGQEVFDVLCRDWTTTVWVRLKATRS